MEKALVVRESSVLATLAINVLDVCAEMSIGGLNGLGIICLSICVVAIICWSPAMLIAFLVAFKWWFAFFSIAPATRLFLRSGDKFLADKKRPLELL